MGINKGALIALIVQVGVVLAYPIFLDSAPNEDPIRKPGRLLKGDGALPFWGGVVFAGMVIPILLTFWVQAWETLGGFECSLRDLLEAKHTHWIGLSFEDVDRINRENNWKLGRVLVPKGSIRVAGPKQDPPEDVGLPSFTGAICAWDDTDEEVVYALVKFLDEKSDLWPDFSGGCPMSLARMSKFPGLSEDMVHPGALKYYREMEIKIGEPIQLKRMD